MAPGPINSRHRNCPPVAVAGLLRRFPRKAQGLEIRIQQELEPLCSLTRIVRVRDAFWQRAVIETVLVTRPKFGCVLKILELPDLAPEPR